MLTASYSGVFSMNARVIPALVLITLSIVISACNQSDDTATKEKPAAEDEVGINAQVIEALKIVQSDVIGKSPKRPDGPIAKSATEYINLSLQHYQDGEWGKCVEAGIGALSFNPSSALAYNNICAAYLQLKDFDRAILACNKALALKPDFPHARGNLNAAIKQKKAIRIANPGGS
jgi:tetratricopeptide (TPR) repeat protein